MDATTPGQTIYTVSLHLHTHCICNTQTYTSVQHILTGEGILSETDEYLQTLHHTFTHKTYRRYKHITIYK